MALAVPLSHPPSQAVPRRIAPTRRVLTPACSERVYLRRRLGAAVLLGTVLFGLSEVAHAVGAALVTDPVEQAGTMRPVGPFVARTAQPGDTLWSLVDELRPPGDKRAAVDELASLNGGAAIRAGELVRIPARWTRP